MPRLPVDQWPRQCGWLTEATPELQRTILYRAARDLDLKERPPASNRSPRIDKYLLRAGVPQDVIARGEGYWCAAWVSAVWEDAGAQVPPPGPRASVQQTKEWAQAHGVWIPKDAFARLAPAATLGFQIIYRQPNKPRAHHVGLLVDHDQWYFRSQEGNTSANGFSDNGVLCGYKNVATALVDGYIRPVASGTTGVASASGGVAQ